MCTQRKEYLVKETLVTVRMRTVQIFCLVSFTFSLFPGQSNFKQGQEDGHTKFWTQRTFFPIQSSAFPSCSPRVAAFVFIQTVQRSLTIWIGILHTSSPSYKNFHRTLHLVPSKIPMRVREGTMATQLLLLSIPYLPSSS